MDEIIDGMNVYAISRLKSVELKKFDGKEPLDFVGDILLKVMEGTRDWNKAQCSFKEFLFGCLRSEIDNFFTTNKNKHTNNLPEIPIVDPSNVAHQRKHVTEILIQSGADDDEQTIFEYWMDGITKPAEIAKDLGVEVKEIYKIIKRLERRLVKIQPQAINVL